MRRGAVQVTLSGHDRKRQRFPTHQAGILDLLVDS
jgi:hypothetical protein